MSRMAGAGSHLVEIPWPNITIIRCIIIVNVGAYLINDQPYPALQLYPSLAVSGGEFSNTEVTGATNGTTSGETLLKETLPHIQIHRLDNMACLVIAPYEHMVYDDHHKTYYQVICLLAPS